MKDIMMKIRGISVPTRLLSTILRVSVKTWINILVLCLLLSVVVYVYFVVLAPTWGMYVPTGSDEYWYTANERSLFENTTLHDALIRQECVTKNGFAGHGFAYTLFDGLIAKAVGFHFRNAIVKNTVWTLMSVLLIFAIRSVSITRRLAACLLILLYFSVLLYLASFQRECMQMLCGVSLSLLLYKAYSVPNKTVYICSYIAVICIAAVFRQSWGIWAIGLIPLAKNWKNFAVLSLLFFAIMVWSVYTRVFVAHPGGILMPSLLPKGILDAYWSRFSLNVVSYFTASYSDYAFYLWCKYLLVVLSAIFIIRGVLYRNPFSLACGVIGTASIASVLLTYSTHYFNEHRIIAPLYYLFSIHVAFAAHRAIGFLMFIITAFLFPGAVKQTHREIVTRKYAASKYYGARKSVVDIFASISNIVTDAKLNTIVMANSFHSFGDVVPIALPVRTRKGYPIRYTLNLYCPQEYQLWNRLDVNYILADRCLGDNGLPIVASNAYYWLYRTSTQSCDMASNREIVDQTHQSVNIVQNGSYKDGLTCWSYWAGAGVTTNLIQTVPVFDIIQANMAVRIQNLRGELAGVKQVVSVTSGTVYRLSGTARSSVSNAVNSLFGGRVAFYLPPQVEQQLIWMTEEYNRWSDRSLVFTNQVTGKATVYVHLGYGKVATTGEFCDIRLERVGTVGR